MKKILFLLVSVLLIISLFLLPGCGGGSTKDSSTDPTIDPTTDPKTDPQSETYFAYVPNFDDNTISIFKLNDDGSLTLIHQPVATGINPVRGLATPDGKYLYVSNLNDTGLSCYRINVDGSLTPLSESLVTVSNYANFIRLNPAGNRIYTVSGGANAVAVFDITLNGTLTKVGSNINAGSGACDIAFTPDGHYAYVCNSGMDNLNLYSVSPDGTLSLGLSYSTGDAPKCLAIHPNGSYLYALNCNSSNITTYQVSKVDGTLTTVGSAVSVGGYPEYIIIASNGQYVYTANFGNDNVSALKVNENGSLTLLNTYQVGDEPIALSIDPMNRFLFVTNRNSNNIAAFEIQSDGTLTDTKKTSTTGVSPYNLVFVKAQ
jgi:6-phosphogluconolactonase (cycloisomerase 2 family)